MHDISDEDMDSMTDSFLHSLIKNMSEGMVNDVKGKKTPVLTVDEVPIEGSDIEAIPNDEETDEDDEEETTPKYVRGRRFYPNNF